MDDMAYLAYMVEQAEADEAEDYDPDRDEIDGYEDQCEVCGAEVEETQRYCHECGLDRLAYALQNMPADY